MDSLALKIKVSTVFKSNQVIPVSTGNNQKHFSKSNTSVKEDNGEINVTDIITFTYKSLSDII